MRSSRQGPPQRREGRTRTRRGLLALIATALALAIVAAPASAAPDNLGTDFHLGFITNYTGNAEKTLFITGPTATTGTVTVDGLGFSQGFTVTPGTVTSVALPAAAEMPAGEGTADVAVHVTAADEVAVYGLSRIQFTTDAYLGLPTDVMDGTYTVTAWPTGLGGVSEFGFVGTEDATTVTITPSVATQGGHAAGVPYDVTLNAGQMYQVQSAAANDDLSGTTLQSAKKIAVFGGHQCANIPSNSYTACDHVVEQLSPNETWGTSFLTVPLKTRVGGDTFKFLAAQDGTEVRVNGAVVANLNAGQSYQQIIDGNSTVTSNKPIYVAQFSNSSSFDGVTSDPFMMMVPPFEQYQTGYTITTPATGFPNNFLNIVAPDAEVGSIAVDGTPVPAGDFTPIGTSGFQGAQVDIAIGSHTVTGSGRPFGVFVYGFADFDSYGYAGGLSLAPVARVVAVTLTPPAETLPVGSQGCVTATVTDQNGARVPGVRVDFTVAGVNPQTTSVVAGATGEANLCYQGANEGVDTITGAVGLVSGSATKTWGAGGSGGGGGGGGGGTTTTTPTPPPVVTEVPSVTPPPTTTVPSQPPRRISVLSARLSGVPSRGCVSASTITVRASVRGKRSGFRATVRLDGKVIARTTKRNVTVSVPVKRLKAGRHRVVITASGRNARTSTRSYVLRKCSAVSPTFTG